MINGVKEGIWYFCGKSPPLCIALTQNRVSLVSMVATDAIKVAVNASCNLEGNRLHHDDENRRHITKYLYLSGKSLLPGPDVCTEFSFVSVMVGGSRRS